jgi:Tat protein secretion system quality control protein TatD with DNase activity
VGACLARVRQLPLEALAAATSANARRLFRLPGAPERQA